MSRTATLGMIAASAALMCGPPPANAADANNGKSVFTRCAACHTNTKGGPNGVGPNLYGVVGRKAATRPDFSYSNALKNAHVVWTPQKLDAWISNPMKLVPGARMVFAGIADAKQRADLIAYLATLK